MLPDSLAACSEGYSATGQEAKKDEGVEACHCRVLSCLHMCRKQKLCGCLVAGQNKHLKGRLRLDKLVGLGLLLVHRVPQLCNNS
jgi:hypothetical protein